MCTLKRYGDLLEPATTTVEAAAKNDDNKKNNQKSGEVHVDLLQSRPIAGLKALRLRRQLFTGRRCSSAILQTINQR